MGATKDPDTTADTTHRSELLEIAAMAAGLGRQELRQALATVTATGVRLTGAEFGAFFYSGADEAGERLDVYALAGAAPGEFPAEVPVRHTALFSPTFQGEEPIRVDDVLVDPRYGGNPSGGVPSRHAPVRSYLAVPVVAPDDGVLGALLFGHPEPGRFDLRAEQAAQAVAAQAATAAENARLLGEARRAQMLAEAARGRLELLQQLTSLLSTVASTAEIATQVPGAVGRAVDALGCHLMLVAPAGDALTGALSEGYGPDLRRRLARLPLDLHTPSTQAVRTRIAVYACGAQLQEFAGLRDLDLGEARAMLAVPVLDRTHRALGALATTWRQDVENRPDVQALLEAVAAQVAQALERARLFDAERQARAQLADSVTALTELARTLQSGLLPTALPPIERARVAVRYLPAVSGAEVGGDWYDVIVSEDVATFVIGDVQGHSTTAAGLMGQLRTAVRAYVSEGHDPATALERTNSLLLGMGAELFATCALMQVEQATGHVVLASAGHPPPLLLDSAGHVVELEVQPGPPLGVLEDATYTATSARAESRSRLLLYTDGVVESAADADERGLAAVMHAAADAAGLDCESLADRVIDAIPHRLADDAALLVVDYAGPRVRLDEDVCTLPPGGEAAGVARRHVDAVLGSWDVGGQVRDTARLLVSEMVTNAVVHAGHSPDSPPELRLLRDAARGVLRLSVADDSPRHPLARAADADALGGRGIAIVEVLSSDWGVAAQGDGKVVWAELPLVAPDRG